MFGYHFYHGTIRKYVTLFGTLFNQIYIDRVGTDGEVNSTLRVPIVYGPKDKALSRVRTNPDFDQKFQSTMPYMSFEMPYMRYDASRHLSSSQKEIGRTANKNLASWVYTPVPYNFTFVLSISTKYVEDATRIIEQIAPFFTPEWTVTVKLIDEPIITKDITVVLQDHQIQDSWDGSYNDKREIIHTLTFEMQGFLFGPATKSKIIKKAIGAVTSTRGGIDATVTVTPGLTVNGSPTNDPDETVEWSDIAWDDDFGYITESEID